MKRFMSILSLCVLSCAFVGTNLTQPVAAQSPAKPKIYAALGDSIAAGQGLTPSDTDTRCDRSSQSYAYTVAKNKKLTLVHAACNGATAGDLVTQQWISGTNPRPQLDAAFANGKPELISITAGANDMRWFDFLKKCYGSTCGSQTDTTTLSGLRWILYGKLYYAFTDIQVRSGGKPPTVVLTGYYNPLGSRCDLVKSNISAAELSWINLQVNELNKTLQDVAKQFKFVKYAPVSFKGHDICARDSWVQKPQDTAPLHPTARGQQAIAEAVLKAAK